VPSWDLYVVYEGTNPDTKQPIIKAILNPLVGWIWAGLVVLVFGTLIALVPRPDAVDGFPACSGANAPTEPALKGGTCEAGHKGFEKGFSAFYVFDEGIAGERAGHRGVFLCWRYGCEFALQQPEPPADVYLRMRADSWRMQPRGLPQLLGRNWTSCEWELPTIGATSRFSIPSWPSTAQLFWPRPPPTASTWWPGLLLLPCLARR